MMRTSNQTINTIAKVGGHKTSANFIVVSVLLIFCLGFTACHHKQPEAIAQEDLIEIHRFEQVLFLTPSGQIQEKLTEVKDEFNSPLLNVLPENEVFIQQVTGFVEDPTMGMIYKLVDSSFSNIEWLQEDLTRAINQAKQLCPEIKCNRIFTMITGNLDYESRVFCDDHDLVISLDQYVIPHMEEYGYFGLPYYLVNLSRPQYIVPDCITALIQNRIVMPKEPLSLLDQMIMEGKTLYALKQILPDYDDTLLMRYTEDQWNWMTHNEETVWSYLLQNQLLFNNDYMQFHNFIEEAPKTNCFMDSAPRTGCYLGWKIVEAYMANSNETLSELLANNDSQKILSNSHWRPKK